MSAGGRFTDLSGLGPRRFYKEVNVRETDDKQFGVTVDDKYVKTPKRSALCVPTATLANAVAAEWDAQEDRIRPSSMPLTTLTCTALDLVPEFRGRMISSTLKFLQTDTVCIRPAHPSELVEFQHNIFGDIVGHFEKQGIKLNVTFGELSAPQDEQVTQWFQNVVDKLDNFSLAAMESASATAKSIVIAVALHNGVIGTDQAVKAARSEELWQSNVWGAVEGGHDLDDADSRVRLAAAEMIFQLVQLDKDAFHKHNTVQDDR